MYRFFRSAIDQLTCIQAMFLAVRPPTPPPRIPNLINTSASSTPDNSQEQTMYPNNTIVTFHPFPRLPPEIRYEIWTLSLPAPRLIDQILTSSTPLSQTHTITPLEFARINREARSVLLWHYRWVRIDALGWPEYCYYFSPDRDVLFASKTELYFLNINGCEHLVKKLGIDEGLATHAAYGNLEAFCKIFSSLNEVFLVRGGGRVNMEQRSGMELRLLWEKSMGVGNLMELLVEDRKRERQEELSREAERFVAELQGWPWP